MTTKEPLDKPIWYEPDCFEYLAFLAEVSVEKMGDDHFWLRVKEYSPDKLKNLDLNLDYYDYNPIDKQAKVSYDELDQQDLKIIKDKGRGAIGFWFIGSDQPNADDLDSQFSFKHYEERQDLELWQPMSKEDVIDAKIKGELLYRQLNIE
jgi:hypothetical protein